MVQSIQMPILVVLNHPDLTRGQGAPRRWYLGRARATETGAIGIEELPTPLPFSSRGARIHHQRRAPTACLRALVFLRLAQRRGTRPFCNVAVPEPASSSSGGSNEGFSSGRPDLNRGPHRPERCALPGCATPRGVGVLRKQPVGILAR